MKTFHRNAFEVFCILVHFVWREEEKKESEKRLFVHREISPQSLWYLLFLVYFASGFSFHLPTYPRQAIKATQTRSGRIHVQMDWKRQNISAFVCRLAVLFFFFKCKWYEVITCFDYGCVSKLCTYFSYPAVVYFLHVFGYWRCVGHRYHFISFHLSWPF